MFKKNQIRETPFRAAVLKLFNASSNALSLKEIESRLDAFDRITLYRTLKLFTEKGIIHEVLHPKGKKYALCQDSCNEHKHKHEHLHFHCSKCKETLCVESPIEEIKLRGYTIDSTEISVYGICEKCHS